MILLFLVFLCTIGIWYWYCFTGKNLEYKDLSVVAPYEATARATGGQVLKFEKSKMDKDQNSLMTAVALQSLKEKDYAMLWRDEGVSGHSITEFSFDVDSSISEVSVFVSGLSGRPEFFILDSKNTPARADSRLVADNAVTEIFNGPIPGHWLLRILKSDNFSVYIRAKTDVRLESLEPVEEGGRTGHAGLFPYKGPLRPGSTHSFLVNFGKSIPSSVARTFELFSRDGRRINVFGGKNEIAGGNLFKEIVIPSEPFRVVVSWVTSQGQVIRRMEEKTFEPNLLELVEFKFRRQEPEDSQVCRAASYLGVYLDSGSQATMLFMCSQNDFSGQMQLYSEIVFRLPLELDPKMKAKTKVFRFVTPDYQKLNHDDCQLASKSFATFPKFIKANQHQSIQFSFSCEGGPADFKGIVEAKTWQ